MNNKPSDNIILKYLLYVYAYVIKWKIKNRWSISFTSDDSLMKDFDIINNPTYMLNRLLNMGVLYLSNSSYLPILMNSKISFLSFMIWKRKSKTINISPQSKNN